MIHPQWCKNEDEAWPHLLENSQGIIYQSHIQDNMDGMQTGQKLLLNHSTYVWTYIQNNNS